MSAPGHCEHCAEGCQGGTVWVGKHLHLHTNIADPTADYTWSCVWESGSCPACAERKRIEAWLRDRWSRCEAPPRGTLAQHELRLADAIESGAK